MTERLLQYIWEQQYFSKGNLVTTSGEALQIITPGIYNSNQGPDFLDARVMIAGTLWAGHIELHLNEQDWHVHGHSTDPNYDNVILHVVLAAMEENTTGIPTLSLEHRISRILLNVYADLMGSHRFIPCEARFAAIGPGSIQRFTVQLLVERLEHRNQRILQTLSVTHQDWEELCWRNIARQFGATVNAEGFEAIAESLPLKLICRHRKNILQLEAMLFGQAGLLNGDLAHPYPKALQKEYAFLRTKYDLPATHTRIQFLRMRPANFPTMRLAQLAMLLHHWVNLFDRFRSGSLQAASELLTVEASDYWKQHFTLDGPCSVHSAKTGGALTAQVIINAIVPLLFSYGKYYRDERFVEKAKAWLSGLPPERNLTTEEFRSIGVTAPDSGVTQALLELKKNYCDKRRCLDCEIGKAILGTDQLLNPIGSLS